MNEPQHPKRAQAKASKRQRPENEPAWTIYVDGGYTLR
jgi:hypothetical protein